MGIVELLLTAIGLSMDAFAVSVCKGLGMRKMRYDQALVIGLYFGVFQALMPLLGWLLGTSFSCYIQAFDHWIAFVLLALIGFNMIREALKNDDEGADPSFTAKSMSLLAVATSIDALAIGITFAFLDVNIVAAVLFIGVCTFVISAAGVKIGSAFGTRFKSKAEIAGGAILIILGLRILVEHLMNS